MADLDIQIILRAINRVSGPARAARRDLEGINRSGRNATHNWGLAAAAATRAMAPLAAGFSLASAVGEAKRFETAMANIEKKLGGTDDQMASIRDSILELSRDAPAPLDEIASSFERAAAAGVPVEEMKEFASFAAKAAEAFEMSPEASSNAFLGFKAGMGLAMADFEKYADLINYLADAGIADESDIVKFIERSGASLLKFGLAREEVAALAATLLNIQMPAEVAARAMDTLSQKLMAPGNLSDAGFAAFESLVGGADRFRAILETDPQAGMLDFLDRLAKLDKFDAAETLGKIMGAGFDDEVSRLVAASEEYRRNLALAADESAYSGSLQRTYDTLTDTLDAKLRLLGNSFDALKVKAGDALVGPTKAATVALTEFLRDVEEGETVFNDISDLLTGMADQFAQGLGFSGTEAAMRAFGDDLSSIRDGLSEDLPEGWVKELLGAAQEIGEFFRSVDRIGRQFENAQTAINQGAWDLGERLGLHSATDALRDWAGEVRSNGRRLVAAGEQADINARLKGDRPGPWADAAPVEPAARLDSYLDGPITVRPEGVTEVEGNVSTIPQGTQDVRVTNPAPIQNHITVTVHATTGADAKQIGREAAAAIAAAAERRARAEQSAMMGDGAE